MKDPAGATAPAERLEFIDSLRGFALFGVFAANLLIFSGILYLTDDQRAALFSSFDSLAYDAELLLVENKFMGLFSLLFGISFWLFLSRAIARGGSATGLFYRRIFWLFVIGLAHGGLLWCFDILRFYALWAVCLPLFVGMAPRLLLTLALICSVLVPALNAGAIAWFAAPSGSGAEADAMALSAFATGSYREVLLANWKYDWHLTYSVSQIGYQVSVFGRLLLGLFVARTFDLGNLENHRVLLRRVLLIGAPIGIIGSIVFAGEFFADVKHNPALAFARRLVVESGFLGMTLSYASGLGLLFLLPGWRRIIRWLAPVGRMALTWYLAQTVFGIWMFYGFVHGPALIGKVGPWALVAVCVGGFLLQVIIARVWLSRFRFGPAEWLWRILTYWKPQPLALNSRVEKIA